jgi:hypothetical protein
MLQWIADHERVVIAISFVIIAACVLGSLVTEDLVAVVKLALGQ